MHLSYKNKTLFSPTYKQIKALKPNEIHKMELAKFMFKFKNQSQLKNFNSFL